MKTAAQQKGWGGSPTENIDVCHGMLHDAFAVLVSMRELEWQIIEQAAQASHLQNSIRYQVKSLRLALENSLDLWERSLGPADAVRLHPHEEP